MALPDVNVEWREKFQRHFDPKPYFVHKMGLVSFADFKFAAATPNKVEWKAFRPDSDRDFTVVANLQIQLMIKRWPFKNV